MKEKVFQKLFIESY